MTGRILLVGMMGAGKTTTGRLVAETLGWEYLDSDTEVERETGTSVPDLFARDGEAAFREAEARVLQRACASAAPVVVSVAGGAVLRAENRVLLRTSGRVIWLRARVRDVGPAGRRRGRAPPSQRRPGRRAAEP